MIGYVIAAAGLYPLVAALLVLGMRRLRRSAARADADCPTVTVVVTARNEAGTLPVCVESLLALDYPADRLDFVLVDDRSTDGTGALLDDVARRTSRVRVLHTELLPDNGLDAKARGLAHGMANATGEWILITDADARVPRSWARHLVGRVDASTALVGGTAIVEPRQWWGRAERTTWAFLQTINLGFAGWGRAVVCVGPNMGIRRSVYVAAGGLERARFRIAEDLALFRMGRDAGGGAQVYADAETAVLMQQVPSPTHLTSQLRRWVGGALEQGPAYRLGVPFALAWGVGVAAFWLAGWAVAPTAWVAFVVAKIVVDALLLSTIGSRVSVRALSRDVLRLWAVQLVAMAWLPASMVVARRIQWRGDGYAVKYT
ncbi:MAG: glycosyltransferase [Gemmatimonadota bacterium]